MEVFKLSFVFFRSRMIKMLRGKYFVAFSIFCEQLCSCWLSCDFAYAQFSCMTDTNFAEIFFTYLNANIIVFCFYCDEAKQKGNVIFINFFILAKCFFLFFLFFFCCNTVFQFFSVNCFNLIVGKVFRIRSQKTTKCFVLNIFLLGKLLVHVFLVIQQNGSWNGDIIWITKLMACSRN